MLARLIVRGVQGDKAFFGVPVAARLPDGFYSFGNFSVACARAHQAAQIVPVLGEQACDELAVRSQPSARAVAAERLGDRSDGAHFAASIFELVVNSRRARIAPAFFAHRGT